MHYTSLTHLLEKKKIFETTTLKLKRVRAKCVEKKHSTCLNFMTLEIVCVDKRAAVVRHLKESLGGTLCRRDVVTCTVHQGQIEDWDEDGVCFINPCNARGIMTGALDRTLLKLMPGLDTDVDAMRRTWGVTAPDGSRHFPLFSALLTRTPNNRWCISSPCTYDTGGARECLRGTRHAFLATHAALSMVIAANRAGMGLRKIVLPGVCTGHGQMNRADAAHQMNDAFRAVFIDGNIARDPNQSLHPRLMMMPSYTKTSEGRWSSHFNEDGCARG